MTLQLACSFTKPHTSTGIQWYLHDRVSCIDWDTIASSTSSVEHVILTVSMPLNTNSDARGLLLMRDMEICPSANVLVAGGESCKHRLVR